MTQQVAARSVTSGPFARGAVEELSRRKQEPEWLQQWRLTAWEQADRLPFPTGYERAWKYFNPERLKIEETRPEVLAEPQNRKGSTSGPRAGIGAEKCAVDGTLAFANGRPTREEMGASARERSVVFCSLETAAREHPGLVQKYLGSVVPTEESVFVALNSAFWSGGAFVYIPRDVKVELPLHVVQSLAGEGAALFPRVLIVVDRGAEVSFLDERGGGEGESFVSSVTEIVLGDEAKVQHYGVQRWGAQVQELFFRRAEIGRNAHLITADVGLGGSVYKGWVESRMRGAGARSDIFGAVFGTGDQYFDVITLQDHIGDHTVSDLLIKSALRDRSQSAYYGLTRVGRHARMADANQEDRNLLLSDKAKAEADPVLEILTSEVVRCAHGASAGPVDLEQLFYLESRGLPRAEAEKLLVQGFLGDVLRRVPRESVRAVMEEAVLEKLGG